MDIQLPLTICTSLYTLLGKGMHLIFYKFMRMFMKVVYEHEYLFLFLSNKSIFQKKYYYQQPLHVYKQQIVCPKMMTKRTGRVWNSLARPWLINSDLHQIRLWDSIDVIVILSLIIQNVPDYNKGTQFTIWYNSIQAGVV